MSQQTWPSGSLHTSKKECKWEIHSGFETHEEGHDKSKPGAINGSTKWALVQQIFFKKITIVVFIRSDTCNNPWEWISVSAESVNASINANTDDRCELGLDYKPPPCLHQPFQVRNEVDKVSLWRKLTQQGYVKGFDESLFLVFYHSENIMTLCTT